MEVNTNEYLNAMRELIEQGEAVPVPISGSSMRPFLSHHKDTVLVERPSSPLKKGDIVLFQRADGHFVLHRIIQVNSDSTYDIVGDAQYIIEKHIPQSLIFGIVIQIERKGEWITPNSLIWKFYSKIWIHTIPLRKIALKIKKAI